MAQPEGGHVRIIASPEAVSWVRERGSMLFVWATVSRGPRLVLTTMECSVDPPTDALEFERFDLDPFMVFIHPSHGGTPAELWVEVHGPRNPHLVAYWDGLAYVT